MQRARPRGASSAWALVLVLGATVALLGTSSTPRLASAQGAEARGTVEADAAAPADLGADEAAPVRPAGGDPAAPAGPDGDPAPPGTIAFTGHNLFGDANGVFHAWRVVRQRVDPDRPEAFEAVVEVELASVDTGNADRDEHLRTADFFDVARHPIATVRGHSATALEPSETGHPRFALRFDVDLHGVRKTVEGEIELVEASPVVVEGVLTLLRTDFGVGAKPSRWNPMSIDDAVPVRFRIAFD